MSNKCWIILASLFSQTIMGRISDRLFQKMFRMTGQAMLLLPLSKDYSKKVFKLKFSIDASMLLDVDAIALEAIGGYQDHVSNSTQATSRYFLPKHDWLVPGCFWKGQFGKCSMKQLLSWVWNQFTHLSPSWTLWTKIGMGWRLLLQNLQPKESNGIYSGCRVPWTE